MNVLIKSAKIIDPNSDHHNKIMDIYIKDDKIYRIATSIKGCKKSIANGNEIEYTGENLHISPGWFDLHANFGEPGYEQQETFNTGINAALKGGFTGVMVMPNNKPNIDNKSMINYINHVNTGSIIDIIPAGNITKNGAGDEIVEMHDMHMAGCKAFTDDKKSIMRSEVLKVALLYIKDINNIIMNFPNDNTISNGGFMHEGYTSTKLGLKGIPSVAEEIMVDRDINLCKYTNSKLHLSYISTRDSVKKIKTGKAYGLNITADVTLHNLFLIDEAVNNFDTRFKVLPPLRTKNDNKALIKGLKEGVIDVICTDHSPRTDEHKKIAFDNAAYGIIGLETAFGLLGKYILPEIGLDLIIQKISINPRKILNLKKILIKEKEDANITLFNPEKEWEFTAKDIKSKSLNTPFIGQKLRGKALAIYNNGQFKEC